MIAHLVVRLTAWLNESAVSWPLMQRFAVLVPLPAGKVSSVSFQSAEPFQLLQPSLAHTVSFSIRNVWAMVGSDSSTPSTVKERTVQLPDGDVGRVAVVTVPVVVVVVAVAESECAATSSSDWTWITIPPCVVKFSRRGFRAASILCSCPSTCTTRHSRPFDSASAAASSIGSDT